MKNILIIGGSSGIGKKIIEVLSPEEYRIYEISRRGVENKESINSLSLNILENDIPNNFLPEKLDGLVYCPGTINLKPFKSLKIEDFHKDFSINVLGAVKVIKQALRPLKEGQDSPSIVLFSTVAVQQGMSFHTSVSAAKGAIEGLTRSLAAELSPYIRVNCIAPSLVETPLAEKLVSNQDKKQRSANRHPLKRIGNTNDIAQAAKYLLSNDSSWVTGQVLHIDGGLSSLII